MSYWSTVHRRAFAETRELVRLDQPGRIFVAISSIIVPAAVGYLVTPKADPVIRAFASIGALLLAGATAYAWKLLSVPARMAAEASIQASTASLAAEAREAERDAVADKLERQLRQTIEEQRTELATLKAPSRAVIDPDAVYQHGKKVGAVVGPRKMGSGMWCFDSITTGWTTIRLRRFNTATTCWRSANRKRR